MDLRTHPALLHLLIIGTVIAAVAGLRRISQIQAVAPLVAGGIYSIEYGSAFGIVKILALTPGAVHVRLFLAELLGSPKLRGSFDAYTRSTRRPGRVQHWAHADHPSGIRELCAATHCPGIR